jgi:hypothetical protein
MIQSAILGGMHLCRKHGQELSATMMMDICSCRRIANSDPPGETQLIRASCCTHHTTTGRDQMFRFEEVTRKTIAKYMFKNMILHVLTPPQGIF